MSNIASGFSNIAGKIDGFGRGAWIAIMIVGFVIYWPVGLAILAFMIGSGRMWGGKKIFCKSKIRMKETGNVAFDNYKSQTIRRLEEEQNAFEEFVSRLREAKDRAEFDQFMRERERKATES